MHLSIIIPLYNEQQHVIEVLQSILSVQFPDVVKNYEMIIVDDCSTDNSFHLVEKFIQNNSHKNIALHQHIENRGKGAAVRTGVRLAKGDTIIVNDADLELSPNDIPSLIYAYTELGVDFVNGSRYMEGIHRPVIRYRRYLANKFFSFIVSWITDFRITDVACAYKLFRKDLYENLNMRENGFGIESELIIKALKNKKNSVAEVPVRYFPRNKEGGKKLSFRHAIYIIWCLLKYGL